jgi:hypothetical protein
METSRVLIKTTCRPRLSKELLMGEEYILPREMADRLVKIGWAEEVIELPITQPTYRVIKADQPDILI